MAKGVFRAMVRRAGLEHAFTVDPAGTSDIHAGQPATSLAIETARLKGYDIADHRARVLTNEDLERFALPLGMDRSHLAAMRWMAPRKMADRPQLLMKFAPQLGIIEVADPYGGPASGYDAAINLIEAACRGVFENLKPLAEKATSGQVHQND